MSDQALPTCSNCPFWSHVYGDVGKCHRYAPRPGASMSWPATNAADACGEHPDFPAYIAMFRKQNAGTRQSTGTGLIGQTGNMPGGSPASGGKCR